MDVDSYTEHLPNAPWNISINPWTSSLRL